MPSRLVGGSDKVANNLTIRGRDQVMLKVTVAEVQRDIVKQLGIDLNGSLTYGSSVLNFNNSNPFNPAFLPVDRDAGSIAPGGSELRCEKPHRRKAFSLL